jgi:hypothetical protein
MRVRNRLECTAALRHQSPARTQQLVNFSKMIRQGLGKLKSDGKQDRCAPFDLQITLLHGYYATQVLAILDCHI